MAQVGSRMRVSHYELVVLLHELATVRECVSERECVWWCAHCEGHRKCGVLVCKAAQPQ